MNVPVSAVFEDSSSLPKQPAALSKGKVRLSKMPQHDCPLQFDKSQKRRDTSDAGQNVQVSTGPSVECTVPSTNHSSSELQAGKRSERGSVISRPADVLGNVKQSSTFSLKNAGKKK